MSMIRWMALSMAGACGSIVAVEGLDAWGIIFLVLGVCMVATWLLNEWANG